MTGGAEFDQAGEDFDAGEQAAAGDAAPSGAGTSAAPRAGAQRAGAQRAKPGDPRSVAMRSRRKLAFGAGGIALLAVLLILFQYGVFSPPPPVPPGYQPASGATPAQAEQQTAAAFLSAWGRGQVARAARYTDHPAEAAQALSSYRSGLHLSSLKLKAGKVRPVGKTRGRVAFTVDAGVGLPAGASAVPAAAPGPTAAAARGTSAARTSGARLTAAVTAAWSYPSQLTAYKKRGGWWVRWDPALVAPGLGAGQRLVSAPVAPTVSDVTDSGGTSMMSSKDTGLRNIATALSTNVPAGQGKPGVQIMALGPDNKPVANSTHQLLQPVEAGAIKSTIDPKVQAAADSAVQGSAGSAMVVIQPTTGHILAVANNGDNDYALTARVAPGSTNKIITSTALFSLGLVKSPNSPVDCPPAESADGEVVHNSGGESEPPGTPFITDFAASCNNAFDQWWDKLTPTQLSQTATEYYGLNKPWDIGVGKGVPYYIEPTRASGSELGLELFGQGRLAASPLAMASIAATVANGSFKQPVVVAGLPQLAGKPLPPNVKSDLWQVMRAVVTQGDGTAAGVFSGNRSPVYAKTGTADVSGQGMPNSWLVAFEPKLNLAVGCVVLNAGYGAQVAGPEVASVLQRLGG